MLTPLVSERGELRDGGVKEPGQPYALPTSLDADPIQSVTPVAAADQWQAMRTERQAAIEAADAVFEQCSLLFRGDWLEERVLLVGREGHSLEKRDLLFEDGKIACHLHIVCSGVGQPDNVIRHARANALPR